MFEPEFIEQATKYENLGPAYFDAREVAKKRMAQVADEDVKALIEEFSE